MVIHVVIRTLSNLRPMSTFEDEQVVGYVGMRGQILMRHDVAASRSVVEPVAIRYESKTGQSAHRLGENSLQKNLHHKRWVREHGFHNLRFRFYRCPYFIEQGRETQFVFGRS